MYTKGSDLSKGGRDSAPEMFKLCSKEDNKSTVVASFLAGETRSTRFGDCCLKKN